MSQEDIEVLRRTSEAFSRRDLEGYMEDWAPDAVLDWSNSRGLEARVYRGHAEIRVFARQFFETFEDIQMELLDPVGVAEGVLVVENIAYMRGRDGVEVQARSAWMVTIRAGQRTSLTLYQTKQEALEAAGLSE